MRRAAVIFGLLLLLVSCRQKEKPSVNSDPAIKVELSAAGAFQAVFTVRTIDTESVVYGVGETASEAGSMDLSAETGSTGSTRFSLAVQGLTPLTDYVLCICGVGSAGERSEIHTIPFSTVAGPSGLYSWEASRVGVPSFADISLVTQGWHNASSPQWTAERFLSHVRFTGSDGAHWLFDAFLCIDGYDGKRGLYYSITPSGNSATKESWDDLLEAWLGSDGDILKLDAAIDEAAKTLGAPPHPRYVVMSVPDPIMFQKFGDKNSSTVYWGSIDSRKLDFSRVQDQIDAYKWYMDECRERFNALKLKHLELAGFYVLSEELPLNPEYFKAAGEPYDDADTWNHQYKRWEQIIPEVSSYAHACNEGLWWIPYHLAPGYRVWKKLGFDCAWMQPNYYWDHGSVSHPLALTAEALRKYRMGIELEFEYSLVASVMADGRSGPDGSGSPTFYAKDVPLLRSRVREYMTSYKNSGLYGTIPIALYSGTDALHQLASSTDPDDIQMYRDICKFIIDSPLKQKD